MANTIQTLRLTLDNEMLEALKEAEQDFPGLRPTQIIRTVFLKSLKSKSAKVQTAEELLREFDNAPENPNAISEEDFPDWWAGLKKEMRSKKSK